MCYENYVYLVFIIVFISIFFLFSPFIFYFFITLLQNLMTDLLIYYYIILFYIKYLYSIGFLGLIKLIIMNILQLFFENFQQRYGIFYDSILIEDQLPHDFTLYYQPKFSFFYITYNWNEERPEMKQGSGIDPFLMYYTLTTTSKFFNITDFEAFFLFSLGVLFATLISIFIFYGFEIFSILSQNEDAFVDEVSGETTPSHFAFHDFLSYPVSNTDYDNVRNDLYTADQRAPEWSTFIKAFHEDFVHNIFDKEYDQIFVYLLMEDIEDEYVRLQTGISDDQSMRYDFFFYIRFELLYPISRFFFNILPFFFFNIKNPSKFIYSFFYIIIYFYFVIKSIFYRYFVILIFFSILIVLLFLTLI